MYLKFTHDIDGGVFSTEITIDSFGTEQLSEDEEKELLNDFITKIVYRNLTFSRNITMNGSVPEVTSDDTGETVVEVTLPSLSNKEVQINEEFDAVYKIDVAKVSNSAIDNNVLTTKELVAQAYCIVFDDVIREAVENEMIALRAKAPAFAGETLVSV